MFRLDDPENTRRIVSDILPNQTSTIVFNAPPNADVGAHICIETERYFGPTSQMVGVTVQAEGWHVRCALDHPLSLALDSISDS